MARECGRWRHVPLKSAPCRPIFLSVRQWQLYVCSVCGDYALGGWEEVVHLPNARCPGLRDPERLVERVVVVPRPDTARRTPPLRLLQARRASLEQTRCAPRRASEPAA